jgi:pilus assembly protein Flp/PilA
MMKLTAAARRLREGCSRAIAKVRGFLTRKEEGASLVEYALLVALIAIACIVAISALGNGISNAFNNIAGKLP